MNPKLSNKVYDIGKMFVTIIIPALSTLYFTLAAIWDLPHAEQVVGTMAAIATFGGVVLGLSTKSYNNSDEKFAGDVVVTNPTPGVTKMELQLNEDVHVLKNKDELTFKVIGPESIS
jgi:hypothetical protein